MIKEPMLMHVRFMQTIVSLMGFFVLTYCNEKYLENMILFFVLPSTLQKNMYKIILRIYMKITFRGFGIVAIKNVQYIHN